MKYYSWKLDWSNSEGTDPSKFINSDTVRIEPIFANGDIKSPDTLIYAILLKGDLDLLELTKWSVQETTVDKVLEEAQKINPEATIVNGFIKFFNSDLIETELP